MKYFGYGDLDPLVGGYEYPWFVEMPVLPGEPEYEEGAAMRQLRRGDRSVRYTCYLLQKDLIRIGQLPMTDMRIDCDADSAIPMSMAGRLLFADAKGLDFSAIRLQPAMQLRMPDGGYYEWSLGVFLPITPRPRYTATGGHYELSCYDMTVILRDDKLINTLSVAAGTPYIDAITTIIMQAGIQFIIADRSDLLLPEPMQFDIGTSRLEIANALLAAIGYDDVWADERGYINLRERVGAYSRSVKHRYMDDDMSVILPEMGADLDSYEVPNVIIGVVSRPDAPPLRAEWRNVDPASALSIPRRGRQIVRVDTLDNAATLQALEAHVQAEGYKTIARNGEVTFSTLTMPNHAVRDMIYLSRRDVEISGRYMEVGWSMDLRAGATMEHRAQRVVIV